MTAPTTDDGRRGLAHFHDVVIIHWTNWVLVLEHHLRISRDQREEVEHYKPLKAELLSEAQNSAQGRVELLLVRYRRIEADPGGVAFRSGEQIAIIVIESISVFPAIAEDAGVHMLMSIPLSISGIARSIPLPRFKSIIFSASICICFVISA